MTSSNPLPPAHAGTKLLSPLQIGSQTYANRVFMAPLTRARAGRTHVPNALMAEYYSQRAGSGLILAEATMVAADGCAFIGEGGIFDQACVQGWRGVTDAVHAAGGKIALQIWHPGRAAHSSLNAGLQPVSATNRAIQTSRIQTLQGEQAYEAPRQLDQTELPGIVQLFGKAAQRALEAGFDGVQIHAAHGYLIDQFLRDSVNDRSDKYGGTIENRARLLLEIVDACSLIFDPSHISVRISPLVAFNDIQDSDPTALVRYLARALSERNIGALELRQADHSHAEEAQLRKLLRAEFRGSLWVNGGYDQLSAEAAIASGEADAVVFGKAFIANPDLPERFRRSAALNPVDFATLYTPGDKGYTDYAALS